MPVTSLSVWGSDNQRGRPSEEATNPEDLPPGSTVCVSCARRRLYISSRPCFWAWFWWIGLDMVVVWLKIINPIIGWVYSKSDDFWYHNCEPVATQTQMYLWLLWLRSQPYGGSRLSRYWRACSPVLEPSLTVMSNSHVKALYFIILNKYEQSTLEFAQTLAQMLATWHFPSKAIYQHNPDFGVCTVWISMRSLLQLLACASGKLTFSAFCSIAFD